MKPSFAVIGCGKVGRALAKHLSEAGYRPVGFASKSLSSARQAAEISGAGERCFENAWDAAKEAGIVFITTPDDAIRESCRLIVENKGFSDNTVVFHCSGALASTELMSIKSEESLSGVMIGSMHPLQSFAASQTELSGNPFKNIIMAVEGDPLAVEEARKIAVDLGAKPFTIKTEGKILYHAAAVVASNYLVTLMDLAIKLVAASGVSEAEGFEILKPLIKGTLNNIETTGIPDALTGPIARGDVGIVEKHVQAIRSMTDKKAPKNFNGMAEYYNMNGLETIKIALAKGTLSEDAAQQLMNILRKN
jgi:predicted short-subunit dehydrogenase-like oxidoreductase (DUF2520 family)